MKKTIKDLNNKLKDAYNEIDRLKSQISNDVCDDKDYKIDKLNNQVNKNSTNSGIPTSKEIINENKKASINTYNHRTTTNRKTGGQFNHKGSTLTKEKLEEKIEQNNIEVREFYHYINGDLNDKEIIKYRAGIETKMYVEKHIFISDPDNPKESIMYVNWNIFIVVGLVIIIVVIVLVVLKNIVMKKLTIMFNI